MQKPSGLRVLTIFCNANNESLPCLAALAMSRSSRSLSQNPEGRKLFSDRGNLLKTSKAEALDKSANVA